jgi:hydrogenase nickel incorporation protein HypA/HybF
MHELALADAVVTTALEAADKEGLSRIEKIAVRIGELQRIKKETFEFCLKEIIPASEPRLASTVISLEIEPARFGCRPCGHEFELAETAGPTLGRDESEAIHFIPELAHSFLRCPKCQSPDFEVKGGRGISIDYVEGS